MNRAGGLTARTVSSKKPVVVRVGNHFGQDTSATVVRADEKNFVGV